MTINVSIKTLVDGKLKIVRGKRLPIRVPTSATYPLLLERAVQKLSAFDRAFDTNKKHVLLYEDNSHARFLPGGYKHFFNLEQYKNELGRDYKRIVLYICTEDDYKDVLQNGTGKDTVHNTTTAPCATNHHKHHAF